MANIIFKEIASRLILSSSRDVHVFIYIYISIYLPSNAICLGLSFALRSPDQFQTSHAGGLFSSSSRLFSLSVLS